MIQIHACARRDEFDIVHAMLVEMGRWDAAEAGRFGIPQADVLGAYYSATQDALMSRFTEPDAAFFLWPRWNGDAQAGCLGFSRSAGGIAEVQKVYVRPEVRGEGIARALMTIGRERKEIPVLGRLVAEWRPRRCAQAVTSPLLSAVSAALYEFFGIKDFDRHK